MKVPPHCNSCTNKDTSPVKKYSVLLKVQDQTSTTTVLLFDRYVLDLVKVPVQHVLDNDEVCLILHKSINLAIFIYLH